MEKTSILCINVIYALHALLIPFVQEYTSKDKKNSQSLQDFAISEVTSERFGH